MCAVRLAIVGLGMAAKPHLEALSQLSNIVQVAGIHDRNKDKRESVSAQYGWNSFESTREIALDKSIDAVILITPPNEYVVVKQKQTPD